MAKWIRKWDFGVYEVTCSECGAREDAFVTCDTCGGGEWAVWGDSKFCPTCGAKMIGKIDEYWGDDDDDDEPDAVVDEEYDFPCAHCVYGNPNGKESGDNSKCGKCCLQSEYKEGQPMGKGYDYFANVEFSLTDISGMDGVTVVLPNLGDRKFSFEVIDRHIDVYTYSVNSGRWWKLMEMDDVVNIGDFFIRFNDGFMELLELERREWRDAKENI